MDQDRRIRRGRGLRALLGGGLMATASLSSAAAVYVRYSGNADALHGAAFLYGERHFIERRDDAPMRRVVLYTCRDGSAFARKTVDYVTPAAPDFTLEDASTGLEEGVRSDGSGRVVFFRGSRGERERTRALPRTPGLVADAGFDEFVRAHWQALLADESLSLHFLIPSRLDDMGFRVQHLRGDHLDGVPVEVFRLKLAGLFGWFLPGIDVFYGARDHVLMRYVGLSDLRDPAGDNMKVDITFDPKSRAAGSAKDLDAALSARLAPCK